MFSALFGRTKSVEAPPSSSASSLSTKGRELLARIDTVIARLPEDKEEVKELQVEREEVPVPASAPEDDKCVRPKLPFNAMALQKKSQALMKSTKLSEVAEESNASLSIATDSTELTSSASSRTKPPPLPFSASTLQGVRLKTKPVHETTSSSSDCVRIVVDKENNSTVTVAAQQQRHANRLPFGAADLGSIQLRKTSERPPPVMKRPLPDQPSRVGGLQSAIKDALNKRFKDSSGRRRDSIGTPESVFSHRSDWETGVSP